MDLYGPTSPIFRPGVLTSRQGWNGTGRRNAQINTSDTLWPSADLAFYSRVFNPFPFRSTHAFVYNGSAVAGNIDIGVYTTGPTGGSPALIGSIGATAQAGTTVVQVVALTLDIPAGDLILALSMSSGAARSIRSGDDGASAQAMFGDIYGLAQEAGAVPLPANMTPVALSNFGSGFPWFGVTRRLF